MAAEATAADAGARWDARGWIVLAAALVAAWLVLRSMAVGLAGQGGSPALARTLAPDSASYLIDVAGVNAMRPGKVPGAAKLAMLDRAAIRAPLRYEPFFARTLADEADGQWQAAVAAGEEARAREPRDPAARAALLDAYLHQGRYAAAIAELNAIIARSSAANDQLLRLLTLLADDPRTAPLVERALRDNPRWRGVFLDYAGTQAHNKALLFRTLAAPTTDATAETRRGSQANFLRALIQSGDYDRAYLAWVNFLSPALAARVQPIYDGEFAEPTAPAPFNWTLSSDAHAAAERTRDTSLPGGTALDVQFFGTGASDIASQTLLLPPGSYAFSVRASGSSASRFGGTLAWQLVCRPSGTVLPLATLASLPARPFAIAAAVTVPDTGCQAQELVLHGEPGDVASTTAVQFNGLSLTRR